MEGNQSVLQYVALSWVEGCGQLTFQINFLAISCQIYNSSKMHCEKFSLSNIDNTSKIILNMLNILLAHMRKHAWQMLNVPNIS
uniref:Uncharacterized protein n=1 Tax=Anguilla anguilla TaxID=7936 RepID=A0A0E9WMB0_ANGAN